MNAQLPRKKIVKKYFIGDATTNEWSTVYNYRPNSEEKIKQRGEISAVISLFSKSKQFSAVTAGNLIVDRFHEAYFESKKSQVTEALSEAIRAAQTRLTELLEKEESASEFGVDFNIATLVVRGDEVYYASFGSNKIFLLTDKDGEKLIDITSALRDPFGKGIVKLGSSFAAKDQRYLLATSKAADELERSEIQLSLASMSDLRLKNKDYNSPQKVALFMLAVDPDLAEEEVVEKPDSIKAAVTEKLKPDSITATSASTANTKEAEQEVSSGKSTPEENIDTSPKAVTAEDFKTEGKRFSEKLSEKTAPQPQTAAINQPKEEEKEEEANEEVPVWQEKAKFIVDKIKETPTIIKKQYNKFQQRRDQQKLQKLREKASEETAAGEAVPGVISRSKPNTNNMTTVQALLAQAKYKASRAKDVVLYDWLKVNSKQPLRISRDSNAFKLLVFVGVIILIFVAYQIIASAGRSRETREQVNAAYEQLEFVRNEIDSLQNNAVLNSQSFRDIPERESLLAQIEELEARFTDELDVLPEEEVAAEKELLAELRNQVLKLQVVEPDLLLDVGNSFEGEIIDVAQIDRNLYILDPNGSLYSQPVFGGDPEVVLEGLESPLSLTADANNDLVVYESGASSAISIVNPATQSRRQIAGLSSTSLPAASDMEVFNNTNGLYVVTETAGSVYLSNRVNDNYSLPNIRYDAPQLAGIQDIEIIDGIIYLLSEGSGIDIVGVEDQDEVIDIFARLQQAINNGDALASDSEYIYIYSSELNRIIVITTPESRGSGRVSDFVGQIELENIDGEVLEVIADQDKDLIFLATNRKIYAFKRSVIQ
jgi:hypothetical protein